MLLFIFYFEEKKKKVLRLVTFVLVRICVLCSLEPFDCPCWEMNGSRNIQSKALKNSAEVVDVLRIRKPHF